MKTDAINRSALLTTFEELKNNPNNTIVDVVFLDGAMSVIDSSPALDVQPVVHARWIYGITLSHEWRKCSECLVSQEIFGCFTYCPNCGARMDAEESV